MTLSGSDSGQMDFLVRSALDSIDFNNSVLRARMTDLCAKDDELRALLRAWGRLQ